MAVMGRPTKYTPELLEKARKYITDYHNHEQAFPSEVGLAVYLGVAASTVQKWNSDGDKPEFSGILSEIQARQQIVAWDKGLKGTYNASLVKLLLGKHGYHDRVDQNNTGEQALNINISRTTKRADT